MLSEPIEDLRQSIRINKHISWAGALSRADHAYFMQLLEIGTLASRSALALLVRSQRGSNSPELLV
jgi:hypothetical protein